jgi:nucleotide-binding universal stress UspA family protein
MSNTLSVPQKMLIGVDDSEGSAQAVDYATMLAEKLHASVVFVHVVTLGDAGRKILEACETKARERHVGFKSFLEVGEPAKVILAKAEEETCDCIVIGKKGQPKIDGNLLSSTTAQKLVTLSKVPLICV